MRQVIVEVSLTGDIKIDCVGFEGKECEVTKALEEALGKVKSSTKKKDYYVQDLGRVGAK